MGKQARARKPGKPIGNQPAFDLAAELGRILGGNATTIDGIDAMTIQTLLAEAGPDLSAWKTERQRTSWLNLASQRDVSEVGSSATFVHTTPTGWAMQRELAALQRTSTECNSIPAA